MHFKIVKTYNIEINKNTKVENFIILNVKNIICRIIIFLIENSFRC